jgi:flavin-binding protein dodecin
MSDDDEHPLRHLPAGGAITRSAGRGSDRRGVFGGAAPTGKQATRHPAPQPGADRMAETSTYKIVEIAGTSTESLAEAMRAGVKRASATLRNVDWVEVTGIRGHVEGGEIEHFQVEMKIGFKLDG